MTIYAVHSTDTGRLVSVGSVIADPLPQGLTAVELSVDDGRSLRDGTGTWDAATRTVVALPPDPAVVASEERQTGLRSAILTLQAWAAVSRTTTVTGGNAVAVLQTVIDRQAAFFDRFADLLIEQYGED